ncbi:hypothetical protein GGTG_03924 [Gaeumannomyces tritici R3-111a-1]|uniref:Uncharacterized protein n=1 Tax=Gaeumannomyces tritici (strain R3-111a-1) TaxID=644352 RepID=J3NRM2_GAET3|nr:hypothetical protein GGTG_03924 [Gaeumannomyces tritici R3-111a-1]EJT78828.1 hypothetical protein GGTG_03924 [Gaeumannomyces tritici R3-111a-1]
MVSTYLPQIHTSQQSANKTVAATPASPLVASPFKRKTMSLTQTYYLAHKARAKLSAEAQRPDHDLRKLVGSANLLDALMVELADAEREQESWFNQSVRGATTKKTTNTQDRRVQWADSVVEEPEEDWEGDDALSDSDDEDSEYDDDEDVEMADVVSLTRIPSHTSKSLAAPSVATDEDYFDEEEEEDYAQLTLTRSQSRSAASPPDLDHDSDSSEDEAMPPSPPTASLPSFTDGKQQAQEQQDDAMASPQGAFYSEGFYLPPRSPARVVSAISVY